MTSAASSSSWTTAWRLRACLQPDSLRHQPDRGVRLTDPASGKTWSLGDKMMITIVRADVNLGKIDLKWLPPPKPEEGRV